MTQPPGEQPPHEGFGAPREPRPAEPGAGHPPPSGPYAQQPGPYGQQPGPDSSPAGPYGQGPGPYDQQSAYQQSGPYGHRPGPYQPGPYQPGAYQPGPYGQQQPPYGPYHPQQFPGAPARPPGGRAAGRGRPGVVVSVVAAALLVIGAGTWFAVSGDDEDARRSTGRSAAPVPGGPSSGSRGDGGQGQGGQGDGAGRAEADDLNAGRQPGESKVLWTQTNDVDLPRNGAEVYGPWFVGDTLVKAMYREVVGYSAADGRKKWTLSLPAEVCAAPAATTAGGLIVIGYKNGTNEKSVCNQLRMVDLNTGKGGWKKEIAERGAFDLLSDITLAISGDTVTAARTSNANAYRVSDGKDLFGKVAGFCQPYAFAGGPGLIAAESCPTADFDTSVNQVQELDPVTGKAKWTYKLPTNWDVDKVYSVDPPVISIKNDAEKSWSVLALRRDGTLRSELDGGKDAFQPDCGGGFVIFSRDLEGCSGVAVDSRTVYLSTAPSVAGLARSNEMVAFDLDTGKPRWRSKAPTGRVMVPLRMEGGNVLVYLEPTYDQGGAVATVAPAGGAPRTLQRHPASTARIESGLSSSEPAYRDGRFYLVSGRVSARDDAEEMKTRTMMAFGG